MDNNFTGKYIKTKKKSFFNAQCTFLILFLDSNKILDKNTNIKLYSITLNIFVLRKWSVKLDRFLKKAMTAKLSRRIHEHEYINYESVLFKLDFISKKKKKK